MLRTVLAVPATRTIRGIPSEVRIGPDDGMPDDCALVLRQRRPSSTSRCSSNGSAVSTPTSSPWRAARGTRHRLRGVVHRPEDGIRSCTPPRSNESAVSSSVLDNAVWHALTTHHQAFAEVAGAARRYQPDVSVFAAIDDTADGGAWDDLAPSSAPSSPGALFRPGPVVVPPGWTRHGGGEGHQMVLEDLAAVTIPDPRSPGRRRRRRDARAGRAHPTRPVCRADGRARRLLRRVRGRRPDRHGRRTVARSRYCEISAVCTHPDWRGGGLAAGLTALVAQRILERDGTSVPPARDRQRPRPPGLRSARLRVPAGGEWSVVSSP